MMEQITITAMTYEQAINWKGRLCQSAQNFRDLLLEGYEGKAWEALGYSDYTQCLNGLAHEFGFSPQRAWQELNAAKIERNLLYHGRVENDRIPERHLRPLSGLSPDQQREAWQEAVNTAPNGKITGAHVEQVAFNYKRDSRAARPQSLYEPQGYDACQTPAYALDPLLPYLSENWIIWEPAAGENYLVEALYDSGFRENQIIASDILTGQNFFEFAPGDWDCLVTNPPYSIKYDWLKRCYELGKPFALLVPVEILGTKTAQLLFEEYGLEIMLLDQRINFKMPNKGWDSSAQFPTFWLCWQLLPRQIIFGKVEKHVYQSTPV